MRRRVDRFIELLPFFGFLVFIPIMAIWPASFWYSLDGVVATDEYTTDGKRIVDVDRTIRRAFTGRWVVEEQLKLQDGRYATVQKCSGYSRYRPDKGPPFPATMDWWKGRNCTYTGGFDELPHGTYRLCTFVTIKPDWFPEKKVERCSPDFTR